MKKALRRSLLCLTLVSLPALADGIAIVNGTEYHCQNTCVVTTNSNGDTRVADSMGGWIHRHLTGMQ